MSEPDETPLAGGRLRRLLFGPPRDLQDRSLFHRISLIPLLAWVGLGADGLSSSSYGPEEAFRTLGSHTYLAVGLAAMTAFTVFVIAAGYSRIIERFPQGGGGYIVATSLLGPRFGVVSGCALLVDYVLTITVSIAAAGDALFSFLPLTWQPAKLWVDCALIGGLVMLNIRGVRESVLTLAPIFVIFAVTHLVAIIGGVVGHLPEVGTTFTAVRTDFNSGLTTLGVGGMILLFLHAYSMGGGTYTGLEAVSNGLTILREPRVHNGKRTMAYMAFSLAFTAGGLLLLYLLWHIEPQPGKTMNAALLERLTLGIPGGALFALLTILAEGALLVVGAQTGFVDGPRVLANMAVDSWMPHRFAALSERLTTQNGIFMMGVAAIAAVLHTRADVRSLVVLYSINVFLTFSLSMFGMLRFWYRARHRNRRAKRRTVHFAIGFLLCATVLTITVLEKFTAGGWITLAVTGGCVLLCFVIRRHYRSVSASLVQVDQQLRKIGDFAAAQTPVNQTLDPTQPTAVILVASYSGIGIHAVLQIHRAFTGYFKNFVFVSVGVIDQGAFKGYDEVEALRTSTAQNLQQYVDLVQRLGFPATYKMAIGTDVVNEAEKICMETTREFPKVVFFTGQVIFQQEKWYHKPLHNQTAFAIQRRLQWQGMTMVILPIRVR